MSQSNSIQSDSISIRSEQQNYKPIPNFMKKQLLTILTLAAAGSLWAADPVMLTISDEASYNTWVNIDGTGDADGTYNHFTYDPENAAAMMDGSSSGKGPDNDWMISPSVTLSGGVTYKISAMVKHYSSYTSDYERFTLSAGTQQSPEGMIEFYNCENFKEKEFTLLGGAFTPESDGTYYIGLKATSSKWMGKFWVKGIQVEELLAHPGAVWGFDVNAAAEGALEAVLSWNWPEKSDLDSELTSISGARIYRNTSRSFASGELESLHVATVEGGTPGAEASYIDTSVPAGGEYWYMVVPFNENGTSSATAPVKSSWVGSDTFAKPVTEATATATGDRSVTITFIPPTEGVNGGWIDTSKLSYEIRREYGNTTEVLEYSWSGDLPYIDNTIPGLGSYTYAIYTKLDGQSNNNPTRTNYVMAGGSMPLPYVQDFGTSDSFDLITVFHTSGSRDWRLASGYASVWGSGSDVWMVLPPFDLTAGQLYELRFENWNESNCNPRTIEARIGSTATAEGLDRVLYTESVSNNTRDQKSAFFTVETDGRYHIAFRAFDISDSKDVYIDEILVRESNIVPEKITDLSATPGAAGAMSVELTFTLPVMDVTGAVLPTIEKMQVLRNGDFIVAEQTELQPGDQINIIDTDLPAAGEYSYSVVTYLNGKPSDPATTTSGWVGPDAPTTPKNAVATLSEDGKSVTITFEPVETGVNGGYIDQEAIRYRITRMPEETVLTEDLNGTSYTDDVSELTIGAYYYKVTAIHAGTESIIGANTSELVFGAPFEVPYEADFTNYDHMNLWTTPTVGYDDYWSGTYSNKWYYNSADECLRTDRSFDECEEMPWAFTPPVHAVAGEYRITMHAYAYMAGDQEGYQLIMSPAASETHEGAVTIVENQAVVGNVTEETVHEFTIVNEGTLYFGFVPTNPTGFRLHVDRFLVELVRPFETGVDAVEVADAADAEYYNLQGLRVDTDNLLPGIYIRRSGGVSTKVLVK